MNRKHTLLLSLSLTAFGTACAQTATDTLRSGSLGEAVVTGTNQETSRNLLPYTVATVDSRQIEATGKTQLLSALSGSVPSLFVSERNIFGFGVSNGGSGGIKIRGVGGSPTNSVLMMVDGQPQFAGLYSHPVADFYEAEHVDHVEILRGPGSVLYGSNAVGGVINVITKQEKRDGVHTTLSTQYGSYNTSQSSLSNSVRKGRFSSLLSLGYDRTEGTQENFDFKQYSLYAKVGYDLNRHWSAFADYTLMNFQGNDPVYPKLSDPASEAVYHQNVTRGEASLAATNRYATTNGSVRMYYSYGNHYVDDPRHFHSLDDRFGLLAYQNFRPWHLAEATVGFDFDVYTGRIPMSGNTAHHAGSLSTMGHRDIIEYSPYATLAQGFWDGLLTLNGGLRMANSDEFGTHWIPQAGFALHPGKGWSVKASVAKGYRNPSFRELYLYRTANADLEPETMMNYEVTLGKAFSKYLTLEATAYFSEGDNLIQTVDMKNQNTGGFINKGVEVSATSQVLRTLALRASYSYMHTSLDALTAAPKNQYFFSASWDALPCLSIDAQLRGVGGLYVADGIDHQNYALLSARIAYRPWKWLELFAHADNITNAQYTINRGYEMPGITAMGGIKLRF